MNSNPNHLSALIVLGALLFSALSAPIDWSQEAKIDNDTDAGVATIRDGLIRNMRSESP